MKIFYCLAFCLLLAVPTHSEVPSIGVSVIRDDPENPLISVSKSTFYGALGGSLISLALMLLTKAKDEHLFKWSFAGGTFLGLGYGIYHVATRPQPSEAMLEWDKDGLKRAALPSLDLQFDEQGDVAGFNVALLEYRF